MLFSIFSVLIVLAPHGKAQDPIAWTPGPYSQPERPLFLVPTSLHTNWTPIMPSSLICPPFSENEPRDVIYSVPVAYQVAEDHPELKPVKGFLCSAVDYIVHCSEGFFGTKTITKRISHQPAEQGPCMEAREKHNVGTDNSPYFPAPSCSWMSEQESKLSFMLTTSHDLLYDAYNGRWVDGIFPQDGCSTSVCATTHAGTLWIVEEGREFYCPHLGVHTGIHYMREDRTVTHIRLMDRTFSTSGACTMTYCGRTGTRFSNGLFYHPSVPITSTPCRPDQTISFLPQSITSQQLEVDLEDVRDRSECLNAHTQIMLTNKTTFNLLSKFNPHYTGTNWAYRMSEGVLQRALASWTAVVSFNASGLSTIGMSPRKQPVTWKVWVPSGVTGMLSGFNGVHYVEASRRVVIPDMEKFKSNYADSLNAVHEILPIPHPAAKHYKNYNMSEDDKVLIESNSVDISGWIGNALDTLEGKIVGGIIGIIILIISVKVLLVCIPKCRRRRERDQEALPLQVRPKSRPHRVGKIGEGLKW